VNKKDLRRENKILREKLFIAKSELMDIKSSSGYRTLRLVGHAKNELKRSPLGFTKRTLKKIVQIKDDGSVINNIDENLRSNDEIKNSYYDWIWLNEPDETELERQRMQSSKFSKRPTISIVTPVFNPPKDVFIDLIESVLAQTYPNFELCLGNFGDSKDIDEVIDNYAAQDPRIKNYKFNENKGIAGNSNLILKKVKGEFIALLDHDDTLSPDALFENVCVINSDNSDFIFSDKDKIDEIGNRFDPFFKPGWSPDIMLNANYLTHLNVMRTSLVKKVGGWSEDTDGAQDWDLFLKITSNTDKIRHIPKVLYHWRVIATSTALSIETKPYALEGQRVTVDRYLKKLGLDGSSYHEGAELLIKWKKQFKSVELLLISTTHTSTNRFLANLPNDLNINVTIITTKSDTSHFNRSAKVIVIEENGLLKELQNKCDNNSESILFLVSDLIDSSYINKDVINNLAGWLNVPGVGSVYPRLIDRNNKIVDAGAIVINNRARPIFLNKPPYYQSIIGNVEWVKNVSIGSSLALMFDGKILGEILSLVKDELISNEIAINYLYLQIMKKNKRNIFNPKVVFKISEKNQFSSEDLCEKFTSQYLDKNNFIDPYVNPNIDPENPMELIGIQQQVGASSVYRLSGYNEEAISHAVNNQIDMSDIEKSISYIDSESKTPIKTKNPSILFILPGFNAIYAGLNNIFSFASYAAQNGSKIGFAIMTDQKSLNKHKAEIEQKYSKLRNITSYYSISIHDVNKLPSYDIAICTQWATAYILVKYNRCNRKCYFIQDKESSFYPKGTISALVDNTYKFGFYAIANTPGLLKWYEKEYKGTGLTVKSRVDLSIYEPKEKLNITPSKPYKIFFYGRPAEPRNAFELGIAALNIIKIKYKKDIEIYSAGAEWDEADFNLEGVVKNLGKISYDKLPSFYRNMDAGLMFMFSGHPGVVASELMASGCPVVVNEYNDETWNMLYKNNHNAITALPTAKSVAEALERVLIDTDLREKLIKNGIKTVYKFYENYEQSCDDALKKLRMKINN
jgi:glycosyltransferase involved in cell wall biosynthesis